MFSDRRQHASDGPMRRSPESVRVFVLNDTQMSAAISELAPLEEGVMGNYNPAMQRVHLANVESDAHGLISKRTAELDGLSVTQVTFNEGARWSIDLKEYAGTELCELPHVALVISGALGVRMADGSEEIFSAGDVMLLPPGHDAWTVGEEACTFVEFSRGNDYYA
jgi:ethanolamine utilization protein EutQ (cupin superfamily)